MKKHPLSMRMGLLTTILVCWIVPIVIIVTLAGVLLGNSYEKNVQAEIDSASQMAMRQIQNRFSNAINASKAVSYDGIVRSAYRTFQENKDESVMYRSVNDYLNQKFTRDDNYKAVFVLYWDESITVIPFVQPDGTAVSADFRKFTSNSDNLIELMRDVDTNIQTINLDGELCMVRNLLDSHFEPYATLVMVLDSEVLFQPLQAISRVSQVSISVDDLFFEMGQEGEVLESRQEIELDKKAYSVEADGHSITSYAMVAGFELWQDTPWLGWITGAVALLVLPMLAFAIVMFYRHVTMPMRTLVEANGRVSKGERGYQIDKVPLNDEFKVLYDNFNAMSVELKNQFERSYLEQQATQKAKIKALQSQINPHFLNNTLEIINWEARLASNDRVSAMIDALSTMLNAALNRDERTQIPLSEELVYVDAYLYIIKQRLGSGVKVTMDIDSNITDRLIPCLILQPLVENAVEHDITARHGGEIVIRAYCQEDTTVLEVEHDGSMTDSDKQKVQELLSDSDVKRGSGVGISNVAQRIRLIYGENARLSIVENVPGRILAKVVLPVA